MLIAGDEKVIAGTRVGQRIAHEAGSQIVVCVGQRVDDRRRIARTDGRHVADGGGTLPVHFKTRLGDGAVAGQLNGHAGTRHGNALPHAGAFEREINGCRSVVAGVDDDFVKARLGSVADEIQIDALVKLIGADGESEVFAVAIVIIGTARIEERSGTLVGESIVAEIKNGGNFIDADREVPAVR